MKYLLAIDQGTSSTRAMLYTQSGQLVSMSQYPITQTYPKAGWVEHCPEEIWSKTLMAIKEVSSQINVKNIIACGITNQRETTLIWDKQTGKCLYPAIVWQDRRTESFCKSLNGHSTMIKERTGLRPEPYFSASKLHWLLATIPEARTLAKNNQLAFGTIDTFLLWRLTKGKSHCTDVTNASRTLLYNIFSEQWDDDLLKLFNVPSAILPNVYASDAAFGEISSEFLGTAIPITAIAGDQQAALIGQCCFEKGMTKATFGTGGFLLMNTGNKAVLSHHNLLTTIAYKINNHTTYGLEGSLYHAGTTIKWLRDEMKLIASAADSERLAASLNDNDGVYFVPSFTGLGAPHWISTPGAIITGLFRNSNPAHFARAALESVAYQTRQVLDCMREDSGLTISVLRVDGGMTVNQWLLQFLSSQCNVTIQKPHDIETTALGVAMLAALGCGEESSLSSIEQSWHAEKEVQPEKNEEARARNFAGWLKAIKMLMANKE